MRLRVRLLAGMAVAVLLGSACGGNGGDTTTSKGSATTTAGKVEPTALKGDLASAASASCTKVRSGRFEVKMVASGGQLPAKGVTATFTGEFDDAAKRAHLNMDFTPLLSATGKSRSAEGGTDMAGGLARMEIVADGDTTYVKAPFFSALAGGGKPWVKFTKDQGGVGFSSATFGTDICDFTQVLSGVSGDVRRVGTEKVGGTRTVHFRATIDVAKAAAAGSGEERAGLEDFIKQAGLSAFPVDVWIADDGTVRRLEVRMEGVDLGAVVNLGPTSSTSTPSGAKGSVVVTITFTDVNETVTIELPPADQVAEPSGLFGNMTIPPPGEN